MSSSCPADEAYNSAAMVAIITLEHVCRKILEGGFVLWTRQILYSSRMLQSELSLVL